MSTMEEDFSAYENDFRKLLDPAEPLDSRTRELYRLKETILKTPAGIHILAKAVDTTDSTLLQHELVYNIGQSRLELACPYLDRIIRDSNKYSVVTRHEAIESLGAIAAPSSKSILEHYMNPANEPQVAIRESCELALRRILLKESRGELAVSSPVNCAFASIDPAPAFTPANTDGPLPHTIEELENILCDTTHTHSLWARYQAMFSLRNIGGSAATAALTRALREDNTSALLRHEVAFVLGQLEHPESQPALIAALQDENEAPMVRHEAAEALGAIADPKTLETLAKYATHEEQIVRDSCVVAIEMHKYWSQFNSNSNNNNSNNNNNNETVVVAE